MEGKSIPKINLDSEGKIQLETIDVPIMISDKEEKFVLRKLTASERNTIRSQCAKTKFVNNQPIVSIDESELMEKLISTAIVEAPVEHSLEDVKKYPADVLDYLYDAWEELSGLSDKKKDNLEKP